LVVPAIVAVTSAPTSDGFATPKSTTAETPTVHVVESDVKYGSVQEPGTRPTSRAIGAFGCAPLPALDQPRM
jgi:hypothetical protein